MNKVFYLLTNCKMYACTSVDALLEFADWMCLCGSMGKNLPPIMSLEYPYPVRVDEVTRIEPEQAYIFPFVRR